ncbi:minor tail protein [Gordonia phage WhoseManz]|nr:minor tail protein [Gordonia phage WhoseManz]
MPPLMTDAPPIPMDDRGIVSSFRTESEIEIRRWIGDDPMGLEGYCNDYIEAEVEFTENETGTGHIEVPPNSKWASIFANCDNENVFVHVKVNGEWWTGRVDKCRKVRKGKKRTIIAELVSDYVWLEAMFCWPNNFAPLGIQWPKKNVKLMPTKSMIESYLFEVIFRLQAFGSGLYRFPIGFFNNPGENWWSMKVKDWAQPCVVIPGNILYDTTRWNSLLARMTPLDELFKDVLYDEHCVLEAKAFVPGRDPQPSSKITLEKPCIYFQVKDKRGVVGRTGTVLDGLFNTVIDTIDPFLTNIVGAFTESSEMYSLSKFFGTDPKDPWVVIREDDIDDDIEESEVVINSPQAHTGIVGGQSSEWLNKGIEMIANAAISGVLAMAGVSFLSDLISGELSDIALAFQSQTDERRRAKFGLFCLPEAYPGSGTTAYTYESVQALRKVLYETRPHRTFSVTINDGKPFIPFVHFGIGDPIGWEDDGEIHVDYVRRITVTLNRAKRTKLQIQVGDNGGMKDPMELAIKRIQGVKQAFDFWTLSDSG